MKVGIKRQLDSVGRLALPKELRKLYNLEIGEQVCFVPTPEGLLLCNPECESVKKNN